MDGSVERSTRTRDGVLWVLGLSGLLGFWMGIACFPNWQVAVETAQVVGGLVRYPADNPFYIYHVKLWTVLHEILAVLLRLGVSEITLSEVVSGVLGMASLQALSLFVFAFSRDVVYSLGAAFAIFLGGAAAASGTYPIDLMGTTHTYGALGLSAMVLTAGLLGAGCYRLGGILLGVMPAIHPSLGVWLGVIVAISVATDFKKLTVQLRTALPWFMAGCGLTVVSLALHLMVAHGVRPVEKEVADRYLSALIRFWDGHRRPADPGQPGVYLNNPAVRLNLAALPLALAWLLFLADNLPRAAAFLLRFVLVSASLAIGFVVISFIAPDWLPGFLQILMPMRLLNIVGMTFVALLFGLIGAYRRTVWGQLAGFLLLTGLLLGERSMLWRVLPDALRSVFEGIVAKSGLTLPRLIAVTAIALTLYAFVDTWLQRRNWNDGQPRAERDRYPKMIVAIAAIRIAVVGALMLYTLPALKVTVPRALLFRDRMHDPVFTVAAAGEGLLLTGDGLHLIQLRTRRPVLLDGGGLDGLAYSLDAGPAMDLILRDVYGVDLLHPAGEGMWSGTIPPGINRRTWEGYSLERWREIRRTYNVTQVLTTSDWQLSLPLVVQSWEMRLYEIPLD